MFLHQQIMYDHIRWNMFCVCLGFFFTAKPNFRHKYFWVKFLHPIWLSSDQSHSFFLSFHTVLLKLMSLTGSSEVMSYFWSYGDLLFCLVPNMYKSLIKAGTSSCGNLCCCELLFCHFILTSNNQKKNKNGNFLISSLFTFNIPQSLMTKVNVHLFYGYLAWAWFFPPNMASSALLCFWTVTCSCQYLR